MEPRLRPRPVPGMVQVELRGSGGLAEAEDLPSSWAGELGCLAGPRPVPLSGGAEGGTESQVGMDCGWARSLMSSLGAHKSFQICVSVVLRGDAGSGGLPRGSSPALWRGHGEEQATRWER